MPHLCASWQKPNARAQDQRQPHPCRADLPTTPPVIRSQGSGRGSAQTRVLDARPDTLDFRDRMFEPTLIEVQTERPLDEYRKMKVPILDQGTEGACTGFGLATVVHYLLRTRDVIRDDDEISPRMLYNMARRYDEWPGEKYSGSSARGAMKGWHKHGVCSRSHWIYDRKLEKQDTQALREALRGRVAPAARRVLPRQSQGPHRDARRDHRGRHSLRDVAGPRRVAERGHGRRHRVDARVRDHRRTRVRHRGLRPERLLDSKLVGRRLGQGRIRADLVRRLAGERQ